MQNIQSHHVGAAATLLGMSENELSEALAKNTSTPAPQLVDRDTLAKACGVHPATVGVWANRGIIQRITLGRKCVRFDLLESMQAIKAAGTREVAI